jgi:hypothetical protein
MSFIGCDDHHHITGPDRTPPLAPTGVEASNGDGNVLISWLANREQGVAGYNVYRMSSYNGKPYFIGTTTGTSYLDKNVQNGVVYYYGVTAYDYNNLESDMSVENAYGVPRPQDLNQVIYDFNKYPDNAGFSFSTYSTVAFDAKNCDFYYDMDTTVNRPYIDVYSDSKIKDMGLTTDIYDITYAPLTGYSTTSDAPCVANHTYVINTFDNHYAKIRVSSVSASSITFDWAFQLITGETMLKTGTTVNRTLTIPVHQR